MSRPQGPEFKLLLALTLLVLAVGPLSAAPQEDDGAPAATATAGPDLTEANALIQQQDYASAEALLAGLQDAHPQSAVLLHMRGELLLALGRPPEALEMLTRAVEIEPDRPRLQFQYGTALASNGRPAEAVEAFGREAATSDDPQIRTLSGLNRSALLQQLRRWPEAAESLEAVLVDTPDRLEAYGDLASIHLQDGRPDRAAEVLERGAGAGFRSAHHFYSVGARFYRDRQYSPAVRMLKQAVSADPEMAAAERSLAAALEKLGRADEAAEHLRRYLELKPDAPDADAVQGQLGNSPG